MATLPSRSATAIGNRDLDLSRFPDAQHAKQQTAWIQFEAWLLGLSSGQGAQEIDQGQVGIGLPLSLLSGARKISTSRTREETREVALPQQVAGLVPFLVTGLHEIVVIATGMARFENERLRHQTGRRGNVAIAQWHAVEVAEDGLTGVGTLATGADLMRHGRQPKPPLWKFAAPPGIESLRCAS